MRVVVIAVGVVLLVMAAVPVAAAAQAGAPQPGPTSSPRLTLTIPAEAGATPRPTPDGGNGGGGGGDDSPDPDPRTPPLCRQTDADGAPAAPMLAGAPASDAPVAAVQPSRAAVGSRVLVTAQGFEPGEQVQLVLYSAGTVVDSPTARADGTISSTFTIPRDVSVGAHTVGLTGWHSCIVAGGALFVVSPDGGQNWFPWIVWLIVGAALVLAVILLIAARLLHLLPFGGRGGVG